MDLLLLEVFLLQSISVSQQNTSYNIKYKTKKIRIHLSVSWIWECIKIPGWEPFLNFTSMSKSEVS